jgi:hypothetical protein
MRVRKYTLAALIAVLLLITPSQSLKITSPTEVPETCEYDNKLLITYLGSKDPEDNIEYVPINSKVKVHYIAWTKDTKQQVDSTLVGDETSTADAKGIPFEFQQGHNNVIMGIDRAVLNMKKGQTVTVEVPSSMAYGEFGYDKIPPNQDLIYEITVVDFEKVLGTETSDKCQNRDHYADFLVNNEGQEEDQAKCQQEHDEVEDLYIALEDGSMYDLVTFQPIPNQTLEERGELIKAGKL